jgi:adenosylmethionine-8-amino-7-oxononanoate aminotransferase
MQAGLACSEPLSGKRLARALTPAVEMQRRAVAALSAGGAAETLSIHTSGGLTRELSLLAAALETRLPFCGTANPNWFFNLQIEGASAVHAGVDGLLQLQQIRGHSGRTQVAVAASSYHGPPSTSPGSATPFGPKSNQLVFPAPTVLAQDVGEGEPEYHLRMQKEFTAWLDQHADTVST